MIETSDLVRAYLKTEQRRYRVLARDAALNIYRGKALVATLFFGADYVTCKLMEGGRKVGLHHPRSLELLMETLKCFEFITSKVFEGELGVLDVMEICNDDSAWPQESDFE